MNTPWQMRTSCATANVTWIQCPKMYLFVLSRQHAGRQFEKNVESVEQVRNRTGLHSAFNATWLYSQGLAQACHRFRLMRGMLSRSLLRLKHAGKKVKKLQFKREVSKKWSSISEGRIACVNVWWWNVWCEVNTMWTWYGPWLKKICVLFDAVFFKKKKVICTDLLVPISVRILHDCPVGLRTNWWERVV